MKRWVITAFLIIIFSLFNLKAYAHKHITEDTSTPLNAYCTSCKDKEVDVEAEIIEHFRKEPLPVSLDECIGVALLNNFNIKATYSDYISSKWDYRNALAQFLPDVTFQAYSIYYKGQVLVGGVVPDEVKELAISGTMHVTHDLTKGGEQIFEAKAQKFKARANLNNLDFTKDEIILETAKKYYELLKAKISIEIQLKNLYERTAQLKLTQNLMEAGLGTKFDVIRSKSEQALAEQSLISYMETFRSAQAQLANVMGIDVSTAVYPIEIEMQPFILVDENLSPDELFKIAKFSRDDIKTLENQIKTMKQEKYKVYTEFVPKPRILYQGQFQGTARVGVYGNNVVGAYLDVPIGSRLGVGTVTKANSVQARIESAKYKLQQLLRDIEQNIISDYYSAELLKERIEIAKRQSNYATESVKRAELRLDAGEGILIDVIQAQGIKNNARIELLNTIVEYNVNQIQLLYDNGTISYDNIVKNYKP